MTTCPAPTELSQQTKCSVPRPKAQNLKYRPFALHASGRGCLRWRMVCPARAPVLSKVLVANESYFWICGCCRDVLIYLLLGLKTTLEVDSRPWTVLTPKCPCLLVLGGHKPIGHKSERPCYLFFHRTLAAQQVLTATRRCQPRPSWLIA